MRLKINTVYKRVILFSLLFSLLHFSITLSAKNVTLETASQVAFNVFSEKSGVMKSSLEIKEVIPVKNGELILYRIFNFSPKGYIIITADDNAEPVIGYGLNTNFDFDDAPPALLYLLGEYKQEMEYIVKNKLKADDTITGNWEKYSDKNYVPLKSYTVGTELLETNWNQGSPYNNSCPLDPNTGYRCLVGCTAVALGQILNYWNCKVFPDGSRTYYPNIHFTNPLTVNFYDQDYDWEHMTTDPSATAELLYHCGVAIRVNYTDSATSGYSSYVEYAMENNFGFQTSGLKAKSSNDNPPGTWINMLKADIDAGRPIYYDGTNTTVTPNTAHAWVIDGYNATDEFHCNWGWGGDDNDWYYLTDLTPGSHNYNSNQHAIIGSEPILDGCGEPSGPDLVCSSDVTYSVTIPGTASVTWSKSTSLDQVGVNTNPTYTVNAATSETTGFVTATIKNSQGQTFLTRTKNLWVGVPDYTLLDIDLEDGELIACDYTSATAEYNGTSGIDAYEWYMPEAQDWEIEEESGAGPDYKYVEIDYWEDPPPYYEDIYIRAHNTCGWSNWEGTTWPVFDNCGGWLYLLFTPNPTTGETTLTIETNSSEKTFDETAEWDLEVYSETQLLKTKQTSLRGQSAKIQTAGWKEGVYLVRVNYNGEVLAGKMVVKR
jgi:hypothetical protein